MVMRYRCADTRAELGVYTLGAIEPADRDKVERHLGECSRCRDELASLAGLPALLRRVPDPQGLLEWDPPIAQRETPQALLHRAARLRRRAHALAAAAAAALIAVTAAVSTAANQAGNEPGKPQASAWQATVHGTSLAGRERVWVRYSPRPWGTVLEARIFGVRAGTRCQLWVAGPGGQRMPAGSWTIANSRPAIWYPASVSLSDGSLRSFEITIGGGGDLVSVRAR
jgi:anti-sigma factor RsiW